MNLVFDIDGCVLNFFDPFYTFLTGKKWQGGEVTSFYVEDLTPELSKEFVNQKLDEFFDLPSFCNLPFYHSAKDVINLLVENGHSVYACSHIKSEVSRLRRLKNLSECKFKEVKFVNEREEKLDFLKLVNCDYFVEDHPDTIKHVCSNSNFKIIMPLYGYNKHIVHKNVIVVDNDADWWRYIYYRIEEDVYENSNQR